MPPGGGGQSFVLEEALTDADAPLGRFEKHEPPLIADPYQFGREFAFLDLVGELDATLQGMQERHPNAFLFAVILDGPAPRMGESPPTMCGHCSKVCCT